MDVSGGRRRKPDGCWIGWLACSRLSRRTSYGNAFPQLRKVSLVELGTHIETALVLKPCRRSEAVTVPALLKRLPPDALLLVDRGCFSYSLWKAAISRDFKLLARVPHNTVLKPLKTFRDGSFLARIYPSAKARRHDEQGIHV